MIERQGPNGSEQAPSQEGLVKQAPLERAANIITFTPAESRSIQRDAVTAAKNKVRKQ